jgi:hypothetical protein
MKGHTMMARLLKTHELERLENHTPIYEEVAEYNKYIVDSLTVYDSPEVWAAMGLGWEKERHDR